MTSGDPPADPAGGPAPRDSAAGSGERLVWASFAAVLAIVIAWGAYGLLRGRPVSGSAPPVLGEVPAFRLTERSGAEITRESLLGKIWIADFVFTRCTGICPLLSGRMRELQASVAERQGVELVSFSVDPEYDTTEVLDAYARKHGADPARWLFLTGDWEATRALIGEGFRLSVSKAAPGEAPAGELITHSDRMVLVDRRGRIRGYYHGTDDEGIELLLADLDRISKE